MTKEEDTKKINELKTQKRALDAQISQVNKEFKESSLMELEEQGITTGAKVLVKMCTFWGAVQYIKSFFVAPEKILTKPLDEQMFACYNKIGLI